MSLSLFIQRIQVLTCFTEYSLVLLAQAKLKNHWDLGSLTCRGWWQNMCLCFWFPLYQSEFLLLWTVIVLAHFLSWDHVLCSHWLSIYYALGSVDSIKLSQTAEGKWTKRRLSQWNGLGTEYGEIKEKGSYLASYSSLDKVILKLLWEKMKLMSWR